MLPRKSYQKLKLNLEDDEKDDDENSFLINPMLKREKVNTNFNSEMENLEMENLKMENEVPPISMYQKFVNGLLSSRKVVCSCSRYSQYILWLPFFGSIVGVIMGIRGGIDGQISFFGSWLRIIYFSWFAIVNLTEEKFARGVRLTNSIPNISGLILTVIQLYGIMKVYECKEWNEKCL